MDSSMICTKSLDWVHNIQKETKAEFIGFYAPQTIDKTIPVHVNWFFAAIPKSQFVGDWFNSEDTYVASTLEKYYAHNLGDLLPYLVMHLCATVVFQKSPGKYKVHLMDTMDEKHGPFRYLFSNNWELPRSIERLCVDKDLQTSLIKLRGAERHFIEAKSDQIDCKQENIHHAINNIVTNR